MTISALLRESCYIDGEWVAADGGETIAVTNPATGEQLGTVPKCGAAETRRAIEAAQAAFPPGAPGPPRNGRRSCAAGSI